MRPDTFIHGGVMRDFLARNQTGWRFTTAFLLFVVLFQVIGHVTWGYPIGSHMPAALAGGLALGWLASRGATRRARPQPD